MGSNIGDEDERSENALGPMISMETFMIYYLYVTVYVHALGYGRHRCAICFWKGSPFYMPCLAQVTLSQTGYKQGKIFLFRLLSE